MFSKITKRILYFLNESISLARCNMKKQRTKKFKIYIYKNDTPAKKKCVCLRKINKKIVEAIWTRYFVPFNIVYVLYGGANCGGNSPNLAKVFAIEADEENLCARISWILVHKKNNWHMQKLRIRIFDFRHDPIPIIEGNLTVFKINFLENHIFVRIFSHLQSGKIKVRLLIYKMLCNIRNTFKCWLCFKFIKIECLSVYYISNFLFFLFDAVLQIFFLCDKNISSEMYVSVSNYCEF